MVPQEYVVPYLISNAIALGVLGLAVPWPRMVKWIWVAIFTWAALINTWTAINEPWVYIAYGALTPSDAYRHFIEGWFSQHIPQVVLLIAAGQMTIAVLLARSGRARRLGVCGGVVFLTAIAPLGVGSGFPFSLTGGLSLLLMEWRISSERRKGPSPASKFVAHPDTQDEHVIDIHAPAGLVFDAARQVDLLGHPLVALIVRTRARLMRDHVKPRPATGLVAETLGLGWGVLQYVSGRTLVMGAVARPWAPDVTFSAVEPSQFSSFKEPDLVKIVWTLEAEPLDDSHTRFRTETRVEATGPAARRKFLLYWFATGAGIRLIRWAMLRSLRREAEARYRAASRRVAHAA